MKIPSTPAPAPASDTPPSGPAAPAGTDQSSAAPDDFMALLAQLVTGSATTTASQAASETVDAAVGKSEDEDSDLDLSSLIPTALPLSQLDLSRDMLAANADAEAAVEALLGTITKNASSAQATQLLDAALTSASDGDAQTAKDLQVAAPTVPFADALATHRGAQTAPEFSVEHAVNAPVGSPQWRDEIGARISLMVQQGNHSASLRLSPEHLGPLEVRISVQNDQASVWFGAAHADTRAAIEHALPRLRELFASQGLSLADAGVFREPPREQPKQSPTHSSSRGDGSFDSPSVQTLAIRRLGLVDAYA
jgi:flagellar hook-length control protein FliK